MLRRTLVLIGVIQLVLGIAFLVPTGFATLIGLETAPGWVNWILAMFGARALGFAYGMFRAAADPRGNREWIRAMIGIQAIDWLGTLAYLATGTVTLAQVTTAAFLPIVFIAVLMRYLPTPIEQ
jgi:hypothetical protein